MIFMDDHENQWILIVYPKTPIDVRENPMISIDIHGYPWIVLLDILKNRKLNFNGND